MKALRVIQGGLLVGSVLFYVEGVDLDLPFYLLWSAVFTGLVEKISK